MGQESNTYDIQSLSNLVLQSYSLEEFQQFCNAYYKEYFKFLPFSESFGVQVFSLIDFISKRGQLREFIEKLMIESPNQFGNLKPYLLNLETTLGIEARYPGPRPFTFQDKDIFFGRTQDLEKLYDKISVEKVVILFSTSGVGKSSLLNAGLIPKLKEKNNIKEIVFRLFAYSEKSPIAPLDIMAGSLKEYLDNLKAKHTHPIKENQIETKINEEKNQLDDVKIRQKKLGLFEKYIDGIEDSFWTILKSIQLLIEEEQSVLLIFDQFEELFTYSAEEISKFKTSLSDVIYSRIPISLQKEVISIKERLDTEIISLIGSPFPVKILFIIREDKFSFINTIRDAIPSIFNSTYQLRPLSEQQVKEAIRNPAGIKDNKFRTPIFSYDSMCIDEIIKFLSTKSTNAKSSGARNQEKNDEVQSFQLQIICQKAEEIVNQQKIKKITLSNLGSLDGIFKTFYIEKLSSFETETEQLAVRDLLENRLINEAKGRGKLGERDVLACLSLKVQNPEKLLLKIEDTRLIRVVPQADGTVLYEISHDTLIAPLLQAKAEREKDASTLDIREIYEEHVFEEVKLREKKINSSLVNDDEFEFIDQALKEKKCILLLGADFYKKNNGSLEEYIKYSVENERIKEIIYYPEDNLFASTTSHSDYHLRFYIHNVLQRFYSDLNSSDLYDIIARLSFPLIVSFSPDPLIKRTLNGQKVDFAHYNIIGDQLKENQSLDKSQPLLMNLFGDVENFSSLIITHDDLFRLITILTNRNFHSELRERLHNSSVVLMLGFDFSKWYLQPILWALLGGKNFNSYEKSLIAVSDSMENSKKGSSLLGLEFMHKMSSIFGLRFLQMSNAEFLYRLDEFNGQGNIQTTDKKLEVNQILQLVEQNNLDLAFDKLNSLFRDSENSEAKAELVNLKRAFSYTRSSYLRGVESTEKFMIDNSRTLNSIAAFLDKYLNQAN